MNNLQANNTTDIQTRITELDSDLTNILNEQAKIGGIQSQMELTENRMIAQQAARDEQFNAIQSVDLAKTISELNFQQTAYEASLGVTGRLFQTSLLNYL
jgi:flagellar hook-associated protein 3 FlgL